MLFQRLRLGIIALSVLTLILRNCSLGNCFGLLVAKKCLHPSPDVSQRGEFLRTSESLSFEKVQ